jgi:hypothetical protein
MAQENAHGFSDPKREKIISVLYQPQVIRSRRLRLLYLGIAVSPAASSKLHIAHSERCNGRLDLSNMNPAVARILEAQKIYAKTSKPQETARCQESNYTPSEKFSWLPGYC